MSEKVSMVDQTLSNILICGGCLGVTFTQTYYKETSFVSSMVTSLVTTLATVRQQRNSRIPPWISIPEEEQILN